MNERERIIAILNEAHQEYYSHMDFTKTYIEAVADHLLANGVTVRDVTGCNYCKVPVYVKTVQYSAPMLAPLTREEELRQELLNLTGEVYMELPINFCPMCGRRLPQPPKEEK